MPECDYCSDSFTDEEAYLNHLEDTHADELGPIDRRRIGTDQNSGGFPTGPIILGSIVVLAVGIVGYTVFITGNSGSAGIGQAGSAHYHGTIEMTVLGDPVDFTQQKYQLQDDRFHFEGDGRWHAHATGVTLEYGMDTLGINVTDESVSFDGEEYTQNASYSVDIRVDGQSVSPDQYVLQDNDRVRIVVEER